MLTRDHNNIIVYEGKTYELNDSYDNCLLFFEMLGDDLFSDYEKLNIGVEMFIGEECKEPLEYQYGLYRTILKHIFDIDIEGESKPSEPIYDFDVDGERIYASFLQDYEINLLREKGKLPWREFLYLLRQLSEETPFKTAVKFRVMEIPKKTKHNKEQVDYYKKMKEIYALNKVKEVDTKAMDDKLGSAFDAYKRQVKK